MLLTRLKLAAVYDNAQLERLKGAHMLNSGDWTAIGTLALAAVTVGLAVVTVVTSAADRRHDDKKRAEDRARDDQLRKEQLDQLERRDRAERIAREDQEARQVIVMVFERDHPIQGHHFNRQVTLSTPRAYPIKWVDGRTIAHTNSNTSIIPFGHSGDDPWDDEQRIFYRFWAEFPTTGKADPIMKFVDWHDNLYYQYRGYTQRFSQNTDWDKAWRAIDEWIRTGPKPE
jgi:hypothetical protein